MEAEVEELNRDPSPIATLDIEQIVDHYGEIIRGLDASPIIMGHSFGGAFTQVLLDRGLGAAGVDVASATVKDVFDLPFSTLTRLCSRADDRCADCRSRAPRCCRSAV
jgi:pimeloyl-ACP methyl ester carboxylesterase